MFKECREGGGASTRVARVCPVGTGSPITEPVPVSFLSLWSVVET